MSNESPQVDKPTFETVTDTGESSEKFTVTLNRITPPLLVLPGEDVAFFKRGELTMNAACVAKVIHVLNDGSTASLRVTQPDGLTFNAINTPLHPDCGGKPCTEQHLSDAGAWAPIENLHRLYHEAFDKTEADAQRAAESAARKKELVEFRRGILRRALAGEDVDKLAEEYDVKPEEIRRWVHTRQVA